MELLNQIPFIRATRRNHALEHASMKVLASNFQGVRMMGHSNPTGFVIIADLPTEIVTDAVLEARRRLLAGEHDLAIHPGCGTNLAASSFLSGAAAFLSLMGLSRGKQPKWWHFLISAFVAVPIYIISKPVGPLLQEKYTTDPNISDLEVTLIRSQKLHKGFIHQICTRA